MNTNIKLLTAEELKEVIGGAGDPATGLTRPELVTVRLSNGNEISVPEAAAGHMNFN